MIFIPAHLVLPRFIRNNRVYEVSQLIIAAPAAERLPETYILVLKKACPEMAVGGKAQAIAAITEMMTDGTYKAN
ncbi:MAG TPA: hypothetical protein VI728_03300, partial [Syntrophales bacterium]|nr:hypothetical protein [Syntrophales bacterium]